MGQAIPEIEEDRFADLRREAEALLDQLPMPTQARSPEVRHLIHELRVHQIELEMQNTELRRAQQDIEASHERYVRLYDFAPVGYLTVSQAGVIQDVNLTLAKMLGVERAHVIGAPFHRFIASDDRDIYYLHRLQLFESAAPQACELKMLRRGGGAFDARLEAIVMQIEEAAAVSWVLVSDITQLKQTEAELHQAQLEEALRHTQKMESLGILAGGIAHDFNNLLVSVLGQMSLAESRLASEHPARNNLNKAVRSAERAADLARQMLTYSGRSQLQTEPLDLNTLLRDNLHLFEVAAAKNIRLAEELEDALPLIEADVGQVQQAIMNLIINAAEAIGKHAGTIVVNSSVRYITSTDQRFWKFTGDPLRPGAYVMLEVRDNGGGIDPNILPDIFDPFFTTKFTGRGLGLAAVLGIVRGHHGGLSVESKPGRGTAFQLVFPALDAHAASAAPNPEQNEPALEPLNPDHPPLILVIDDEEPVREAALDILEYAGMQVLVAADGLEGVHIFRQRHSEIDLVLLDLSMPGLNGEDTFRELKRIDPNARVALSSGYGLLEATERFSEQGLVGFIQKPYKTQPLIQEVRKLLNETKN